MSQEPDNLLAALHAARTQSPHKLLSLRDMTHIFVGHFYPAYFALQDSRNAAIKDAEHGPGRTAGKKTKRGLKQPLKQLRKLCEALELPATTDRVQELQANLDDDRCTNEVMVSNIDGIRCALLQEMSMVKFALIYPTKLRHFEQPALLGEEVNAAFPDARHDIREAGNCLACDLNTAAVVHLMRVAEYGLRAFASKVDPQLPLGDMEYMDWGGILGHIKPKADDIAVARGLPPKKKAEIRDYYNGIMCLFSGIKDAYRNKAMHTRGSFSEHAARDALALVRDLMQRLAQRPPVS